MQSRNRSPVMKPYREVLSKKPNVYLPKNDIKKLLQSDSDDEEEYQNSSLMGQGKSHLIKKFEKNSLEIKNSPKIKNINGNFKLNKSIKVKPTTEWVSSLIESDNEDDESSNDRPSTPIRLKLSRTNRETTPLKDFPSANIQNEDAPKTPHRESKRKPKTKALEYDEIVRTQFSPSPSKRRAISLSKNDLQENDVNSETSKNKNLKSKIINTTSKSKKKVEFSEKISSEDLVQELLNETKNKILKVNIIKLEDLETPPKKKINKPLNGENILTPKRMKNELKEEEKLLESPAKTKINKKHLKLEENLLTPKKKKTSSTIKENEDIELTPSKRKKNKLSKEDETKINKQLEEENLLTPIKKKNDKTIKEDTQDIRDNNELTPSKRTRNKLLKENIVSLESPSKIKIKQLKKEENLLTPTKKNNNESSKEDENDNDVFKKSKTPKKNKSQLANSTIELTPPESENDSLQEVRLRLHVSSTPETLPCREKEFSNIYYFLKNKLIDGKGGCMYISGVPGTGKTASVHAVVKTLQNEVIQDEVPKFKYVEINGLHLMKPQQAYKYLLIGLDGESAKKLSCDEAKQRLETRFSGKTKNATLILVDELDQLCTRKQELIYNLFDWPTRANSKLLVITIANTMDLPERLLMARVASRMGLTRLTFQPYSHKQLTEIVTQRLIGYESSFSPEGAQLIARKVASLSGDARRALDLCRRAAEIAKSCVEIEHVNAALEEMLTSPKIKAILSCSYVETLFLKGVVAEIQRTGVDETVFEQVFKQFCTLCNLEELAEPSLHAGLRICENLSDNRIILLEKSRNELFKKILLNINIDELHYGLKTVVPP